jgi:dihydrofolate synthase/folylpolyglutamate synthase
MQGSSPKSPPPDDRSRREAMTVRSYADALAALRRRTNVEAMRPSQVDKGVFDLSRMRALAAALGNPQDSYRIVHVAGSKGKGSVCEMAAAALRSAGCVVGLYTSPHLIDVRERIRIDGNWVGEEDFARLAARVLAAAGTLAPSLGEATYFELLTMMSFVHFAEQAVDVAVIEVGMGGRYDATNIVRATVCALTAIQGEHREILGETAEDIARHKAGICKAGVAAVSVQQEEGVRRVFEEECARVGATLLMLGRELDFSFRHESTAELGSHYRVTYASPTSTFEHVPAPLKGEHQTWNTALVLAILDQLGTKGMVIDAGRALEGLAATPRNGRLELVHSEPRIMVDGAHNPESVLALVRALGTHVRYDSLVVVFGCAADKDVGPMLRNLAVGADKVIFTRAEGNPRAADPRDLLRIFGEVAPGKMAQVAASVREAINLAARAVTRSDLILATGSFAIAGEAKRLLLEKQGHAASEVKNPFAPPAVIDPKQLGLRPKGAAPDADRGGAAGPDAKSGGKATPPRPTLAP